MAFRWFHARPGRQRKAAMPGYALPPWPRPNLASARYRQPGRRPGQPLSHWISMQFSGLPHTAGRGRFQKASVDVSGE